MTKPDRRQSVRYEIDGGLVAIVHSGQHGTGTDSGIETELINVSGGGAALRIPLPVPHHLELGADVGITVALAGGHEPCTLLGRPIHVAWNDSRTLIYGIEWTDSPENHDARLNLDQIISRQVRSLADGLDLDHAHDLELLAQVVALVPLTSTYQALDSHEAPQFVERLRARVGALLLTANR